MSNRKEQLEERKLELEIEQLAHPVLLRPAYIAAISPIAIALLTFLAAWISGYFDSSKLKLERESQKYQQEITSLQRKISEIEKISIEYKDRSIEDIRRGWGQIVSPLLLLYWEATGVKTTIDVYSLKLLLQNGILKKIKQIDFNKRTSISLYRNLRLGDLTCKQTLLGLRIMETSASINALVLPDEFPNAVMNLRQSHVFERLSAVGCEASQSEVIESSLFSELFDTKYMRSYISELIDLGKLLGFRDEKDI